MKTLQPMKTARNKTLLRFCSICSISLIALIVSGCWSSSDPEVSLQTIGFDQFALEIDSRFETIPPGLVENKQILNKVVHASRIPNSDWFDTNLVVTTSTINTTLTTQDFVSANEQKLNNQLVWYTPLEQYEQPFTCNNQEIPGIVSRFTVRETLFEWTDTYYLIQYQFVANQQGYIISYASDTQDDENLFQTIIKSLQCE